MYALLLVLCHCKLATHCFVRILLRSTQTKNTKQELNNTNTSASFKPDFFTAAQPNFPSTLKLDCAIILWPAVDYQIRSLLADLNLTADDFIGFASETQTTPNFVRCLQRCAKTK